MRWMFRIGDRMSAILKQKDEGTWCLFDTRSNQFMPRACSSNENNAKLLLEEVNSVLRKPLRTILKMSESPEYRENGYLEWMVASDYVKLNHDTFQKIREKILQEENEKLALIQAKKAQKAHRVAKTTQSHTDSEPKKKRGRPRKNFEQSAVTETVAEPKRKRGRPRKNPIEVSTEPKRKRGRPRKNP